MRILKLNAEDTSAAANKECKAKETMSVPSLTVISTVIYLKDKMSPGIQVVQTRRTTFTKKTN